jgi:hypothetical protein
LAGGKLSDDIRAAAIAGATAVAFFVVGSFTGDTPAFGTLQYAENIAGHAAVGCMSAVISGGACGPGAVAGAAGSAVAPIASQEGLVGGTAISGVAGGLASVAVGGKFADGAVTAAFGYLFNACGSPHGCATLLGAFGLAVGVVASGACDVGTAGVCAPANPSTVLATSAAGAAAGAALDSGIGVHGNSAASMQGTDLYYLINNETGDIDKIGITSYGEARYPQSFYDAENVTYVTQAQYTWRYAAMVDENIRLTFYRFEYGQLPRLNLVTR